MTLFSDLRETVGELLSDPELRETATLERVTAAGVYDPQTDTVLDPTISSVTVYGIGDQYSVLYPAQSSSLTAELALRPGDLVFYLAHDASRGWAPVAGDRLVLEGVRWEIVATAPSQVRASTVVIALQLRRTGQGG